MPTNQDQVFFSRSAPEKCAYQIGVLISYVLLGVTTIQVYIYYIRFPEDTFKVKALVAFVYLCEVGHAICLGDTLYILTISDYAHPRPERICGGVPKSFPVATFLSGIIGGSVQGFFAFRVYRLSKKLLVPISCWVMSALRVVMATVICVTLLRATSLVTYEVQWKWALTTLWSVSIVHDLTVTATLVAILMGERDNAYKRTAALVDRLILYTIETGMLTSMSSIAALACFVAMPANFIWTTLFALNARVLTVIVPKVMSNSLLASLNSRTTLRAMEQVTLPLSFIHGTAFYVDVEARGLGCRPIEWLRRRRPSLKGVVIADLPLFWSRRISDRQIWVKFNFLWVRQPEARLSGGPGWSKLRTQGLDDLVLINSVMGLKTQSLPENSATAISSRVRH
ncbi:hypothetical protein K438DRAFT_1934601 [Mycena galopus ATCC 62051]|nr:hypothetical protein K438DRAFT_1934601 [Mycena galopus ATCC 62051]